jgi:ribosomal protein S18 acetylase RimI-like enzyme
MLNHSEKTYMHITVRRAEKKDCPRLLELIQELALYERAPEEVTINLAHFESSGFGEKPVWWAFVAETVPEENPMPFIAGFALYYIRYSTWKGQRMYLEDILVTDSCRGKGIGSRLFERLVEEAREKSLNGIVWQVLEWNKPAIDFYRKYNASFDGGWLNCSMSV